MSVTIKVPYNIVANGGTMPWQTMWDTGVLWRQSANATGQINTIYPATSINWGDAGNTTVNSPNVLAAANWLGNTTASYIATIVYPDGGAPPGFEEPSSNLPYAGLDARPQRSAWLTHADGSSPLILDDLDIGYCCLELDLGYPDVRDVTINRPDQHGVDDRTQFFGKRPVTASMAAVPGGTLNVDECVALFAPYMNPSTRPQLHYFTGSDPTVERVLSGLRASQFASAMNSNPMREFHLAWIATDPVAKGPLQTGVAWCGTTATADGRTYDLLPPRTYPVGGGGPGSTQYHIHNNGDIPMSPIFRIYGPVTGPRVQVWNNDHLGDSDIRFITNYRIDVNHFVDVDMDRKTAYLDGKPSQPALSAVDWMSSVWTAINPYLGPVVGSNIGVLSMSGTSTSGVTQVEARWQDPYL